MRPKAKEYDHTDPRPPSRSQKKRDSSALQVLGGKLADMPASALKRLNLAPRLLEAIKDYKELTKHEARRRQLQFIGALMRETDADPLARAVEDMEAGNRTQAREFHQLEVWRAALIAGDESVQEEILLLAPDETRNAIRPQLRQLVRNARAEAEKNKPPRSARALFRLLRELKQGLAITDPTAEAAEPVNPDEEA
jgi:ribosome-associated protein